MILKDIIERGLRAGTKRYNLIIKKTDRLCAKDNMLIKAQLEAIQRELIEAQKGEKDE
jgi:hypothetical protein